MKIILEEKGKLREGTGGKRVVVPLSEGISCLPVVKFPSAYQREAEWLANVQEISDSGRLVKDYFIRWPSFSNQQQIPRPVSLSAILPPFFFRKLN